MKTIKKKLQSEADVHAWKEAMRAKQATSDADVIATRPTGMSVANVKLAGADDVRKFLATATEKLVEEAIESVSTDRPMVPCIISDDTEDRDRDIADPSGWMLEEYHRNPVLMRSHMHGVPAIGNTLGVHVAGKQLLGVALFAPGDVSLSAYEIGRLYEERIMRAFSAGFIPHAWVNEPERGNWAVRFIKQELVENTACNVGSNRNALAQAKSLGMQLVGITRDLDEMLSLGDLAAIERAEVEKTWALLRPGKSFVDLGATLAAAREEREKQVERERESARAVADKALEVDWRGVAVALSKSLSPASFERAVRANRFAVTSTTEQRAFADARAKSETDAAEVLQQAEANAAAPELEPAPEPAPENTGVAGEGAAGEDATEKSIVAIAERVLLRRT